MSQKSDSSTDWKGPSPEEMIRTHTLAENIIRAHNEPCPVFDAGSLVMLREFVNDPSAADQILGKRGMADTENPDFLGQAAVAKGDLAGFIIARHRLGINGTDSKGSAAMTDGEIAKLKDWFDTGAADERMNSVVTAGTSA